MSDPHLKLLLGSLGQTDALWIVDENLPPQWLIETRLPNSLLAISNRFDVAERLRGQGIETLLSDFDFADLPENRRRFSRIVYRISKEKPVVHHCINQSLRHLSEDGVLVLVGGKQDGIKSIAKNAGKAFRCTPKIKKHGTSYQVQIPSPGDIQPAQKLPDQDYAMLRQLAHKNQAFYSKPGVFGWDKIDRGSELLVSTLPDVCRYMKSVNSVLDLGCGWGYLMLATSGMNIARRVATDNNVAAVLAAQCNFVESGLEVESQVDDCGSRLQERFDLILCNPPFHQGFVISDSLTRHFLHAAARLSRRSTRAVFVVNQFIALDKLASEFFGSCRQLLHCDGFRVFELRLSARNSAAQSD